MKLLPTSLLAVLAALTVTAQPAQPPSSQHAFNYASLPSSAYSPTAITSNIELGGSLTRSSATYSLEKDPQAVTTGDRFVVGIKGGGKSGGWVEAVEGKGASRKKLDLMAVGGNGDTTFYSVNLSPPASGNKATLTISCVLPHQASPLPAALPQNAESIYMLWEGDLLAPLTGLSPEQKAKVQQISVKVKTPTPRIVQAQSEAGFEVNHSQGAALVTFTSKGSVAQFEHQLARVHYQQPQAIASIRKLDRLVELSHWGSNLAIQENIDLFNSGPVLEGNFARIDYQKASMQRRQGLLALSSFTLPLPSGAHNPYYYDQVGNVSTSHFRPSPKSAGGTAVLPSQKKLRSFAPAVLELQPRYPIMGGWNYSFTVGYDLPLQEYVKIRGSRGKYVAAIPFLNAVRDVAVDEVKLAIRLPEGARNLRVHTPFPVDHLAYPTFTPSFFGASSVSGSGNEEGTVVKTYLDSTGRPTVLIDKKGCTDRHGGEVLIEYDLPLLVDLLQKPLVCATAISTIFLSIIFAKRISWLIA